MLYSALLLLACAALGAAQTAPNFPLTFSSLYYSKVALYQGGTYDVNSDLACCSTTSPQCKVQTQSMDGTFYQDGVNNQTALVVGAQAIFNVYNLVKEIAATKSKTTPGAWTCTSYCPLDSNQFSSAVSFAAGATYSGKTNFQGKVYDTWGWFDGLGPIHMDQQVWYVDSNGSSPVPFYNIETLTPFNTPAIGDSEQMFQNFQAGLNGFAFNIEGVDSCQQDSGCQQNGQGFTKRRRQQVMAQMKAELRKTAKAKAKAQAPAPRLVSGRQNVVNRNVPRGNAVWPDNFVANEVNTMVINQGGVSPNPKEICCLARFDNNQCQIQYSYSAAVHYYDFSNQRERFENNDGTIQVNLFGNVLKAMAVDANNNCQYYCPIPANSSLSNGLGFFLDPSATDMGQVTYNGQLAEEWQWREVIPVLNITMEYTNQLAVQQGGAWLPIAQDTYLTPLGQNLGKQHTEWSNFQAGVPPASKFAINNVANCPLDPQGCQQQQQNKVGSQYVRRGAIRV